MSGKIPLQCIEDLLPDAGTAAAVIAIADQCQTVRSACSFMQPCSQLPAGAGMQRPVKPWRRTHPGCSAYTRQPRTAFSTINAVRCTPSMGTTIFTPILVSRRSIRQHSRSDTCSVIVCPRRSKTRSTHSPWASGYRGRPSRIPVRFPTRHGSRFVAGSTALLATCRSNPGRYGSDRSRESILISLVAPWRSRGPG